jgi:hypothetical protein
MAYVRNSLAAILMLVAINGCGGSGVDVETVEVFGTVTQGGQPLGNVTLTFAPLDGGRAGTATVDADGKFTSATTVTTGDGLVVGEHTVTATETIADPAGGDEEPDDSFAGDDVDPGVEVPDDEDAVDEEGAPSTTVTIKSGGPTPLKIEF